MSAMARFVRGLAGFMSGIAGNVRVIRIREWSFTLVESEVRREED